MIRMLSHSASVSHEDSLEIDLYSDSRSGCWTGSIGFTWELVRDANSQVLPQTY